MGVLDKFLEFMGIDNNDIDEEYGDDYFGDDDYGDESPKKNFFNKSKKRDVEEEYDDDDDDNFKTKSNRSTTLHKVTPMRQTSRKSSMGVCVIKPTTVNDAREVTATLLEGSTIILNLEGMDLEVAQRIIDFTSGATVAINGNLQKVSNFIFLVTPSNIDISGDLQDLLDSSFDVPSIKTRY